MSLVLLIDDSATDRQLLGSLVRHLGHEVVEAADAAEGLAIARGVHPDLVITDLLMPSSDGLQLAQQMRSDPDLATTRVVLTTARTLDPRLRSVASSCGVSDVIPKPCEPEEIMRIVVAVLGQPCGPPPQPPTDSVGTEHLSLLADTLFRKVEELKQTNEHLQASEHRFRTLLELAPNAIVGIDQQGRIVLANALTESVFGYARDELLGRPVEILLPEELHDVHVRDREAYARAPSLRPMGVGRDLHGRRKDGSTIPVTVTLSTVGTGADMTMVAAVHDMTERVRAEQERAQMETQLEQAQRLESVGQLAGGIAHDFNNLLAIIISCTEFLAEAVEGDVLADVDTIRVAAERAAGLTHQLLLFSRMERSTVETIDVNTAVEEMFDLLRRTIGEHIAVDVELSERPALVVANRAKLDQVLLNLVVNARDAMPDGGWITLAVTALQVAPESSDTAALSPGDYVELTVADSGSGMDEEVVAHAFEPFFTTKERGRGTGLGLATVYGVIAEAGGTVRISSEVGKGTAVSVLLPRVDAEVDASPTDATADVARGEGVILVVEDEGQVRAVTQRMLVRSGYDVVEAGSPAEALVLAADLQPPALVLTDVVMPGMSGYALARRLREQWPGTPTLVMSGYAPAMLGRDAGDDLPLLNKPFDRATLVAKVQETIARAAEAEAVRWRRHTGP